MILILRGPALNRSVACREIVQVASVKEYASVMQICEVRHGANNIKFEASSLPS